MKIQALIPIMENRYKNQLQWLVETALRKADKPFTLFKEDNEVIWKLLCYFSDDVSIARSLNIDLRKGLLLIGNIGCGKTYLMNLLKFCPNKKFLIKPCCDIALEFLQGDNYRVLSKYGKKLELLEDYRDICFDDLGAENIRKFYGDEVNVIGEILEYRYERFINHRELTHATSNLLPEQLADYYGQRLRSRMRQMFNLIYFGKNSKDKRE